MDGARRDEHLAPPGAIPPEVVHRVHDRYLLEIVEQLGLCPFARRSREQGRVHRPLIYCEQPPPPEQGARRLHELLGTWPDAEIVLLTFVGPDRASLWPEPRAFDEFVKALRARFDARSAPTFFMVGFHPRSGELPPGEELPRLTADSLVPHLRRTPDPVIQCVCAEVLERVKAQAQRAAHARMLAEAEALDPRLRAILERSVQPDSELSAEIARKNFEGVAQGEGRQRLERRIAEIKADRERSYAPWWA